MKKYFFITFVSALLFVMPAFAMPADSSMNVEYGSAKSFDGSTKKLTMDLFFPAREKGKKYPLVILMHGGGFVSGSKEAMKGHCRVLADSGFIAVSINYRKGWDQGKNPYTCEGDIESFQKAVYRATQDAYAAVRFLIDNSDVFAIDTSWIFSGGSSAGAVLALNLAYLKNDYGKKNFKKVYKALGPLDIAADTKTQFTIKGICSMWGGLSDSTLINRKSAVPTIFYHGTSDIVVPYDIGRFGTVCDNYPYIFGSACLYRQTVAAGKVAVLNTSVGGKHGPKEYWYKVTMSNTACFFKKIMSNTASAHSLTSFRSSEKTSGVSNQHEIFLQGSSLNILKLHKGSMRNFIPA